MPGLAATARARRRDSGEFSLAAAAQVPKLAMVRGRGEPEPPWSDAHCPHGPAGSQGLAAETRAWQRRRPGAAAARAFGAA